MEQQKTVHLRFDYDELAFPKKEILSAEINLIKILQITKRHYELRKKELSLKTKILRKLRGAKASLKKLELALPKLEMPKILIAKGQEKEGIRERKEKPKTQKKRDGLESQLEEIQMKLKELEGRA